ncbi:vesicular-fusion protein S17, partial [Varicellaria rhodocarpa]|nr:vesicular-fusion protein S17 [Varicellaria rhodocarpa]
RQEGITLERAASIQLDVLEAEYEAASTLMDAFKAYRVNSPDDAVRVMEQAIDVLKRDRKTRNRAAICQKQIAELLEERLGPYQERAFSYTLTAWMAKKGNDKSNKAKIPEYERLALEEEQRAREERPQVIEAWDSAASLSESDSPKLAKSCRLKCADLSAAHGDYQRAINLFEEAAEAAARDHLLRFSVQTYLFKAGICYLATQDMVAATRGVERYSVLYPSFTSESEYQLLLGLIDAYQYRDDKSFSGLLAEFEKTKKIDDWKKQ